MVTTRSYYLESPMAERKALLARVQVAVAEELPPGADDDSLDLPWVTTSLRYRREHSGADDASAPRPDLQPERW